MGDFEGRLSEGYAEKMKGDAMTPEERLAAARDDLDLVLDDYLDGEPEARAKMRAEFWLRFAARLYVDGLAIGPAADLALAAAVRRLDRGLDWKVVYDETYEPHYTVTVYSESTLAPDSEGTGPTLTAAIEEALR